MTIFRFEKSVYCSSARLNVLTKRDGTHWSIHFGVPQLPIPGMSPSSNAQSIAIIKGSELIRVSPITKRKSLKDLPYLLKTGEFK